MMRALHLFAAGMTGTATPLKDARQNGRAVPAAIHFSGAQE
jgi:hypothetical protein